MPAIGEEGHQLRLSDLPDEILIRILSMLPTEFAVRTCLLIRSWQHLWKSLTRLEFHFREDDMFISRGIQEDQMFLRARGSHFMDFVDRVMYLRDHSSSLVSFCLQYFVVGNDDANRIKTWITKAVQCNVEELTLSLPNLDNMDDVIPCCLFGCQSLVKLDITIGSCNLNVPSPPLICLPGLKYLRLEEVDLLDWEPMEKLLSSPLLELEELILERCWYSIEPLRVCSPKLQILEIHDQDDYTPFDAKIRILGDNLKSFSYSGDLINEYEICASSSTQLTKVEIYVTVHIPDDFVLNCYTILKGLNGTRNLALSDYFLEGLQKFSELLDTIPAFNCLTRLDIRVYEEEICIDSLALMEIYERCPLLEYLNIGKLSHTVRSLQLSPIPLCFRNHLKKILVHYYVPGDEADAAIDVLLNSALALEDLVIYCKRDEEKGFHEGGRKIQELQDRLNRRPRVSKDCIISVRLTYYIDRSRESDEESEDYYHNCYLNTINES